MDIGIIGLGKMGYNIALNMRDNGHKVVAYNRSIDRIKNIEKENIEGVYSLSELVNKLDKRRIIWIMVSAGDPVDQVIKELSGYLDKGDIIIDGGNSNFHDTLRRFNYLEEKSIEFVDAGISGGISGARSGACAMIGAKDHIFKDIEPIFKSICIENGYYHTGKNGSGHYVKMIHNGIEYGMMQAIGEGFEILDKSQFDLDLENIAKVWNHGSVIRSWLMELMEESFSKHKDLKDIKAIAHSSGEGLWTVEEALKLKVPVPVISQSLFARYLSEEEESFSAKVVAALRNEFGGHGVEYNE